MTAKCEKLVVAGSKKTISTPRRLACLRNARPPPGKKDECEYLDLGERKEGTKVGRKKK